MPPLSKAGSSTSSLSSSNFLIPRLSITPISNPALLNLPLLSLAHILSLILIPITRARPIIIPPSPRPKLRVNHAPVGSNRSSLLRRQQVVVKHRKHPRRILAVGSTPTAAAIPTISVPPVPIPTISIPRSIPTIPIPILITIPIATSIRTIPVPLPHRRSRSRTPQRRLSLIRTHHRIVRKLPRRSSRSNRVPGSGRAGGSSIRAPSGGGIRVPSGGSSIRIPERMKVDRVPGRRRVNRVPRRRRLERECGRGRRARAGADGRAERTGAVGEGRVDRVSGARAVGGVPVVDFFIQGG